MKKNITSEGVISTSEPVVEIFKIFQKIAVRYSYIDVYEDFLTILICIQSPDPSKFPFNDGKMSFYEDDYSNIVKKYKRDELTLFSHMVGIIINAYSDAIESNSTIDVLGDLYMEIASHWSRDKLGQFFTPLHVVELMSQLVNEDGYREIGAIGSDPACGSSRFAIDGFSKNRYSYWTCTDVDRTCVKMSAINMALYGMYCSEVLHGDTLSLEFWGGYRISPEIFSHEGREFVLPSIRIIKADEIGNIWKGASDGFCRIATYVKSDEYKDSVYKELGVYKAKKMWDSLMHLMETGGNSEKPEESSVNELPKRVTTVIQANSLNQAIKDENILTTQSKVYSQPTIFEKATIRASKPLSIFSNSKFSVSGLDDKNLKKVT